MTAPIAPIVPVNEAIKLATQAGGSAAQASPPVPNELAQRFQDLMHRTREDTSSPLNPANKGENTVSRLIQNEQNEYKSLHESMLDFVEKAPAMSPMESMSASVAVMTKTTNLHIKTSMATGVTKASNKSLESLLKNQ